MFSTMMRYAWVAFAVWAMSCSTPEDDDVIPPNQTIDASVPPPVDQAQDAGPLDAGSPDSGIVDAGTPSDGGFDAGVTLDVTDSASTVELGVFQTDTQGQTPVIEIDVDSNVESLTLVALTNLRNSSIQIDNLKNPNGVVLAQGQSHFSHKSRSIAGWGIQATMVPESSDFENLFVPGKYTFRVKVMQAASLFSNPTVSRNTPVRVIAFLKQKSAATRFVLDVNLYFTGAAGVDAQAAATNARIQNALNELGDLYAQANIELGAIRYLDTPEGFTDISGYFPQVGSVQPSLADLQRLSAGGPPGLNFFFVESIDIFGTGGGGTQGLLGVAGGIPGPGSVIGSDRSGVVVLFDTDVWTPTSIGGQAVDDDYLGVVMAHEGGHFLGLSHTYEQFFNEVDNPSDTPGSSAPNATDYLMQPSAFENGGILSPRQSTTLRRSTLSRPVP